ncbi:MAG: calcium-translocating P-type ATPase, PMCA-type [Clostridia bacterium]|nr:calcium-translocating P-type ATPase, PMCA-type [Clostridia bacterium]
MILHSQSIEEICKEQNVDIKIGLSSAEVLKRQEQYGKNLLVEKEKRPWILRFLDQFKDFMIIVLLVAALISGVFLQEWIDAGVIFVVVLVNAIIGIIQEGKAEKSLEALKKMSAPNAKVLRNGKKEIISSEDVVPGDIIFIEAGDLVPADARIIEAANLKIEESALTGESVPVEKSEKIIDEKNIPLGDMKNMMFSGTVVTYGRGMGIVVATGMETQSGKIAKALASEKNEETPLQKKLAQIGKYLSILAMGICVAVFIIGMFQSPENLGLEAGNNSFLDKFAAMFMTAVSLAVAAIPEGLPAIVTIVLSMGVVRMVKKNAIVKKLPAVETLGSASVICSDKTGTLTLNQMTVVKAYQNGKLYDLNIDNKENIGEVITLGALCNDGTVSIGEDGKEKHIGDPTETAIVAALMKLGAEKADIDSLYPRVNEVPFDSDRKLMTTVHINNGKYFVVTKGAPDQVVARCPDADKDEIMKANKEMADQALRVLAVSYKILDSIDAIIGPEIESDLKFVGLIGMIDPPRQEAKEAIKVCKTAGIRPVMITGDHKDTAVAIAKGLDITKSADEAISGSELDKMSDDELFANITKYGVYARVSPEHKIRIVKAWQRNGQIVAMTGDGVNDAPSLKAADIGCAMGITGTDVAKGAADMILTDDNFATITEAVKEGRGIFKNIKKAIGFLLSGNLGEIVTIFSAMVMGIGTPLLPVQILWINLVTDSLPALALGVEPVEDGIMEENPRDKEEGLFTKPMLIKTILQGIMIGGLSLLAYVLGKYILPGANADVGHTMAFLVLAIGQLFHSFNMKSDKSLFKTGIMNNKYLIYSFIAGMVLQLAICLIPPVATIFKVAAMPILNWIVVFALDLLVIIFVEIGKLFKRK